MREVVSEVVAPVPPTVPGEFVVRLGEGWGYELHELADGMAVWRDGPGAAAIGSTSNGYSNRRLLPHRPPLEARPIPIILPPTAVTRPRAQSAAANPGESLCGLLTSTLSGVVAGPSPTSFTATTL